MNNLVVSDNEVNNMNERTQSTIKNIKDLQDLEKSLYASLENNASSPNPPSLQQQEQAIQRINELSNMRATLFGNLKDSYSMNQYQVAQTRNDLVDELTTIKVIEGELNNSKKQMNALKKEKIDKLRMVEINTYYGKRYEANADLMKIIILFCVPILIITILNKKNMVPDNISNVIMAIIIVVFIIVMYYKIADILFRDNMDYDQYNFPFDPENVDLDNSDSNIEYLPVEFDPTIECIGDQCCTGQGMVYDSEKNACVYQKQPKNTDTSQMTKEAFSGFDNTLKLRKSQNVEPYYDNSNYVKF